MSWWQITLFIFGGLWAIGTLASAEREAEKAARDAAWARYELEALKGWLERNMSLLIDRQTTTMKKVKRIEDRMGLSEQDDREDP